MSYQFWPPLSRKSPVSCLKRKSPVSWEILMSHAFSINPTRKSHGTWDFLMRQETGDFLMRGAVQKNVLSHEKISCLKRKSHVSRKYLISYHFWPPLMRKSPISCLMRKSLVPRENLMSFQYLVPPHQENLLSPVSWENLMTQEKILCLFSIGSPPYKSHKKISWDMRFSHETGDRRFSHWGGGPKLKRHEIFSWDTRFSHETGYRRFSHWGGPYTEKT